MPASLFTITPTRPTVLKLALGEEGKFSFTIASLGAPDRTQDVTVRAMLVGKDGRREEADWLSAEPRQTMSLSGGQSEVATIFVTPTSKTPVGENHIQLAVYDNDRPHDEYAYSAPVICEVTAPAPNGGTKIVGQVKLPSWLIPAIAAALLLGVGNIVLTLVRTGGQPPAAPPPPPPAAARKVCSGLGGSFAGLFGRDSVEVDDSWTIADCQNWVDSLHVNEWELGCVFPRTAGQPLFSWGQPNGGPPSPNCGW